MINFDTIGTNTPEYNFEQGVAPVKYLDPDLLAQKTSVASYSLSSLSMSYPEIRSYYDTNDEDLLKVNASARANLENIYRTEALFKAGKITNVQQLNQLYQPSGVIERKFANRAAGTFTDPSTTGQDEDGTFAELMKSNPSLGLAIQAVSENNTSLIAAMQNAHNELSATMKERGYVPWFAHHAAELSGIPATFRMLTEPNKEQARLKLIGMPLDNALQTINDWKQHYLKNDPEGGLALFNYMLQPDKIQESHNQFFDALNIGAFAVQGGMLARTMLTARETSRMFKEFEGRVREAVNSNPWVVIDSAVGNPKGAAYKRVAAEEAAKMVGPLDAEQNARSPVMSVFETNLDDIRKGGPSKNGNASFNIITEAAERTGLDMAELNRKAAKVMGVHEALAGEGVAAQVLKEAVESHPQAYDHVINTSPIKMNTDTNEMAVDLFIGTPSGGYYNSAAKVIRVLEDELGLPVTNIHGWDFPYTGERPTGASVRALEGVQVEGKPRVKLRNPTTAEVQVRDATGKVIGVRDVSQAQKPRVTAGVFSEGKGFYGAITVPINQDSKILRDAVVQVASRTGGGIVNQLLNRRADLRTPEEVLSEKLLAERKVAMFTPGLFQKLAAKTLAPAAKAKRAELFKFSELDFVRPPGKLLPELRGALTRALENGQKNREWFKDLPELQAYYLKAEHRLPTAAEEQGYFAFKLGRIMDDNFKDLAVTKAMGARGVERHVFTKTQSPGPLFKGEPTKSDEVLGTVLKEMPIEHPNAIVLIHEGENFKAKRFSQLTDEEKEIVEKVKTGERKGIKLWNSEMFPMNEFAGIDKRKFVQYVVSDQMETRPLGSFKLPRVEGRLQYDYSHYLKQGDFAYDGDVTHYLGDKTIMALERRAIGTKVATALNKARVEIAKGTDEGISAAQAAVRDLPIEWSEIRDKFKSGEWDVNADFHVIPKGRSVSDVPGALGDSKNTFYSGSPHNQYARTFTGADDPYNILAMRSKQIVYNPSLSYTEATHVDPYVSMNRSLSRIINSTFAEDVKHNAINNWMTRYGDKLNWGPYARQDNPFQAFVHAELDKTMAPYERGLIEAERQMIKSFADIPSTQESWIYSMEQRLADSAFEANGPAKRTAALVSRYAFARAVEAPALLRSFAYRFGIGLFNPSQFFTQLNTFTNIYAIGGARAATKGTTGALLHTVSNLPQVGETTLKGLDKMATRFGFRPGEWLEARQHMLDTGFHLVSKETNELRASMYPNKLFKSSMGLVFDAGDVFFNGGEKLTRYGAWYTAWDESAKGLGKMDLVTRQNILNRADMLTSNMTKASRSTLQTGIGSLPSQFLGYWLRTAELFTGSRLSTAQKARMFFSYSLLYGMPSGLALTGIGGFIANSPFEQMMNKAAVDYGWLPENSKISQAFFQGLSSVMVSAATGRDYSLGSKFGIGPGRGLDIWSQDKSIWQMFTGPVGDMIGQTWSNMSPIARVAWGTITGDDARRHLTPDDWRRPLSVISSFSQASKLWYAMAYHEWQSKNENTILSNVSNSEAAMMAFLGIQPEATNRLATVRSSDKYIATKLEELTQQAVLDQQRFFRSVTHGEDSQALDHWKNFQVTMDQIPPEMKHEVFGTAMRANTRSVPDSALLNHFLGKHHLVQDSSKLYNTFFQGGVQQMMGK